MLIASCRDQVTFTSIIDPEDIQKVVQMLMDEMKLYETALTDSSTLKGETL